MHLIIMRTTITMDDGLYQDLKARADASRRTVSQLISDAVRDMLVNDGQPVALPPFRAITRGGGLQPGVDLTRLKDRLTSEDDERFLAVMARDAAP